MPRRSESAVSAVLYFAYGSNLDRAQMRARCPSAKRVARAELHGYSIAFGGHSARWGGAVASIVPIHGARVEGVLYRIASAELRMLDRFEGSPFAYQRITRVVIDEHGTRRRCQVYLQTPHMFVEQRLPAVRYFNVILREYRRHGFDLDPLAAAIGVEP